MFEGGLSCTHSEYSLIKLVGLKSALSFSARYDLRKLSTSHKSDHIDFRLGHSCITSTQSSYYDKIRILSYEIKSQELFFEIMFNFHCLLRDLFGKSCGKVSKTYSNSLGLVNRRQ